MNEMLQKRGTVPFLGLVKKAQRSQGREGFRHRLWVCFHTGTSCWVTSCCVVLKSVTGVWILPQNEQTGRWSYLLGGTYHLAHCYCYHFTLFQVKVKFLKMGLNSKKGISLQFGGTLQY